MKNKKSLFIISVMLIMVFSCIGIASAASVSLSLYPPYNVASS